MQSVLYIIMPKQMLGRSNSKEKDDEMIPLRVNNDTTTSVCAHWGYITAVISLRFTLVFFSFLLS